MSSKTNKGFKGFGDIVLLKLTGVGKVCIFARIVS